MSYFNHSIRGLRSSNYRFTVNKLDDSDLIQLKQTVLKENKDRREHVKELNARYNKDIKPRQFRIKVRPRGPRGGKVYDTPKENATHFDIYVYEIS